MKKTKEQLLVKRITKSLSILESKGEEYLYLLKIPIVLSTLEEIYEDNWIIDCLEEFHQVTVEHNNGPINQIILNNVQK